MNFYSLFRTTLVAIVGVFIFSNAYAGVDGGVGPMLPQVPAPKGMQLVYETHFNQVDIVTDKHENFYLEIFMGKPYWLDAANKRGPAVMVKGRSNHGDHIEEFEERYAIIESECDEPQGLIQKTYMKSQRSRAPVAWEYVRFEPQRGKMYPKDVSSYEVIATQMCKQLNPYLEGQYFEQVKKKLMEAERASPNYNRSLYFKEEGDKD